MEFYGSIHCHTDRSNFRLRDAIVRLDQLCWYAAKDLKHNFIAITDHETIATAIDCQKIEKEIRKEFPEFKIVRGNEIYLCRNGLSKETYIKGEDKFFHFILLAKDAEGHRQIRELSTRAWSRCFMQGKMMRVPTYYSDLYEIIGQNPGHVIFSQACIGSKVAQLVLDYEKNPSPEKYEYIKEWITHISEICGKENYFLEVQPSFNKEQIIVNKRYKILSEELNIPVVISLDVHYLKKEDEPIHHAFLTAQEGERETSEFYASTYAMSREEIHSYMDESLGAETVSLWMNNTQKIYDMCEDYDLTKPTRIVYIPLTVDHITNEEFNLYKNKIKELEYFYNSPHKENVDLAAAIVRAILNRQEDFDNKETFDAIDDNLKAIRLASEKMNTQWSAYLLNLRDYVKIIWEKGNSLMGCSRGCFYPDEKVLLANGQEKRICEMTAGDLVFNHNGEINKVLKVLSYNVDEDCYIIKGKGKEPIHCTWNHKFWIKKCKRCDNSTYKNSWCKETCRRHNKCPYEKTHEVSFVSAKDIEVGDMIAYPKPKLKSLMKKEIDLANYLYGNFFFIEDNSVGYYVGNNKKKKGKSLPRYIPIDKDLAYICGVFIGDGWTKTEAESEIGIAFHSENEKDLESLERCKTILKKYGLETTEIKSKDKKLIQLKFYSKVWWHFFRDNFGKDTYEKHVCDWLITSDKEITKSLLLGLMASDGHYDCNSEKSERICYDSVNLNLIKQVQMLWASIGIFGNFKKRIPKQKNWHISYKWTASGKQLLKLQEDFPLIKIRENKKFSRQDYLEDEDCFYTIVESISRERYKGKVYDLSINNIPSYVINGTSVHNSGTGFFLLYLLNVIQINPLWETTKTYSFRFLNPERVSPLDVDLDIEGGKRSQVYKALQDTYGKDRVSKVLTIRTEKSKSAILTACFKKGTLVNTLNGEKPIEEVSSNDYVETLNGFQKVCNPTYCIGQPSVKIKTKNSENPYFVCTPDHKILTIKKKNRHRIDGDILTSLAKEIFPELKKYKATDSIYQTYICNFRKVQPQWVEAKDIIKNVHYGLVPIDSFIDNKNYITWENDFHKKYRVGISQNIKIDEDFCELIGIWIAEGSILHNTGGIAFTINKNEKLFKKRIIQLMWKVFQMDSFGIYERQDSLALTIQYSSRQIGDFFSQLFTGYKDVRMRPDSHRKLTQGGKRIPEQLKNINPYLQLQIFKGWFIGEGYASLKNGTSPQSKGTTISKELAYDFIRILHRNYLNPSVDFEERADQRESIYNLTFYANKARKLYEMKYHSDLSAPLIFTLEDRGDKDIPVQYNDKLYMRAKIELVENDLSAGEEEVYCLSMPEENFCINHLVVHNCRGLGLDPDEGQYLASFIKSDRGQQRTLEQTYYGDEENGIAPDLKFKELMDGKYNEVWKVANFISGLCCGAGSHAGGVIFYDEPITNSTALMSTTNGDVITQFDLHTIEDVGSLKIDLLSIEGLDRIRACLDLLTEYNYLNANETLRQRYEKAVGIYKIDRTSPKMWQMIHNHKIESLFQMEQQSGIKGIAAVKPTSIDDLAALNAVIRLMASEKGAEQPIEKFARFKKNPELWDIEMNNYGISPEGQAVLKKFLSISYGLCIQQEQFMMLVQQPEIGGFSLLWADKLRKSIAKKNPKAYEELTAEFFEETKKKGCEEKLCKYVWNVLIAMNRGYGFKNN